MTAFETIKTETDSRGIATLTLNRPDKHNAMSAQMIGELDQAADLLGHDRSVRAVVLTGQGKSFCAGADLNWMNEQFTAKRSQRTQEARALAYMLKALNELPKPLIGRINGQAYGGGIGLMSVCDVVVAVETAKFALTEVRLGLIPATISPYVLARMGEANARRVFFSARPFLAEEARELGLVSIVADENALDAAIEKEVAPYLSVAPGAVAAAKKLTRKFAPPIDEEAIEYSIKALAYTWETAEAQEGVSAFLNGEKPSWARSQE